MSRRYPGWFAVLSAAVLLLSSTSSSAAADRKPNVLVILCDDTGWAEFGFQGAKEIPTPHIDSIARNGVRFTQGYVSGPYCSPTRAGLMTGRYQTRFGHEFNSTARQGGLPDTETTIAQRLKTLGYATIAVGKWHLGSNPEYRPMKKGFDEFYGTLANTPFYHPTNFVDTRLGPDVRKVEDNDFYTTEKFGDRVVEFLDKQGGDKPWFVYLPFNAQHAPLQAPKAYLERFPNIQDNNRRTFAAMMSCMDDAVGKVLAKVREKGQEENTLVVFFSDNGGPTNSTTSKNDPLRGFKSTTWEGGVRVPFCMQWKGKIQPGKTYDPPVIQLDLVPTILAAAGATVDPGWKLDGVDLMPFLTGSGGGGGTGGKPHETLYWRFGEQWAVRHGDLKLVVANGGSKQPELYNLAADVSESKNLAGEQPEKVKELQALYDKWNAEQAPPSAPKEKPNQKARQQAKKKNRAAVQ